MDINHLPRSGVLRIYATADYITEESAANGSAEHSGWVDSLDAMPRGISESRNDVEPLAEFVIAEVKGERYLIDEETWKTGWQPYATAQDDALAEIRDILDELGGYDSDDGSTIYGHREQQEAEGVMTYAVHAHVKHYGAGRGWVEDDFDLLTGIADTAEVEA